MHRMRFMSVHSFRDLVAWQRSMTLAVDTYKLTRSFPSSERFGLSFQLRKAATSIPSNVAEGHVKPTLIPNP
jgi:four helix bundle protein